MNGAPERIWARFPEHLPVEAACGHIHEGVEYVRADLAVFTADENIALLRAQSDRLCDKYLAALKSAEDLSRQLAEAKAELARMRDELLDIANSDDIDNALDPERNKRVAKAALSGTTPVPAGDMEKVAADAFREFCIRDWNRPHYWVSGDTERFVSRLSNRLRAALPHLQPAAAATEAGR